MQLTQQQGSIARGTEQTNIQERSSNVVPLDEGNIHDGRCNYTFIPQTKIDFSEKGRVSHEESESNSGQ